VKVCAQHGALVSSLNKETNYGMLTLLEHNAMGRMPPGVLLTLLKTCPALQLGGQQEGSGLTLLHFAVLRCDLEVVGRLVKWPGVEVNAKNLKGETPLDLAFKFVYELRASPQADDSKALLLFSVLSESGAVLRTSDGPWITLRFPDAEDAVLDMRVEDARKISQVVDAYLRWPREGGTALEYTLDGLNSEAMEWVWKLATNRTPPSLLSYRTVSPDLIISLVHASCQHLMLPVQATLRDYLLRAENGIELCAPHEIGMIFSSEYRATLTPPPSVKRFFDRNEVAEGVRRMIEMERHTRLWEGGRPTAIAFCASLPKERWSFLGQAAR
jgi:hypothetical protein